MFVRTPGWSRYLWPRVDSMFMDTLMGTGVAAVRQWTICVPWISLLCILLCKAKITISVMPVHACIFNTGQIKEYRFNINGQIKNSPHGVRGVNPPCPEPLINISPMPIHHILMFSCVRHLFLSLSKILAEVYCRHATRPSVRLSTTFSAITCFMLLECTFNFTYRLIMTKHCLS